MTRETAARLAAVLHAIRRGEKRINVAGAKEFVQIIKGQLDGLARQEMRYWALLFELYQILSLQNEFEDAAIDYAVTFELSPPSWEALPDTIQTAGASELDAQEPVLEAECFMIEGVLSSDCDYKLRDLERHAETRAEIHIDMSNATRVDFVTVGAFIGSLVKLNQSGKQVVISGANGMIHALFDVMGSPNMPPLFARNPANSFSFLLGSLMEQFRGTTILSVRRGNFVALAATAK